MKLLGTLLILNSLGVTGWWLATGQPNRTAALSVAALAVFAGAFLILQDRVLELSVEGVGKIKTAAEEASDNLEEIRRLRARVEAQSATVDLVAQRASEALDTANQAESVVSLANTILAAQNDHRPSFDQLREMAGAGAPESAFLSNALSEIAHSVNPMVQIRVDPKPPEREIGFDPDSADFDAWIAIYPRLHGLHRPHALGKIWTSESPIAAKLEFLAKVVDHDASLRALHRACILINKEAQLDKNILRYEVYQEWWRENRDRYIQSES